MIQSGQALGSAALPDNNRHLGADVGDFPACDRLAKAPAITCTVG
jgi:hypothetical protein